MPAIELISWLYACNSCKNSRHQPYVYMDVKYHTFPYCIRGRPDEPSPERSAGRPDEPSPERSASRPDEPSPERRIMSRRPSRGKVEVTISDSAVSLGWWMVMAEDEQGYAPAAYLESLEDSNEPVHPENHTSEGEY